MPDYSGNPMGSGNPPGQYSKDYLTTEEKGGKGHFVNDKSYRGDMHVGGIVETPPVVGNQPNQGNTKSLESFSNKENSIPSA